MAYFSKRTTKLLRTTLLHSMRTFRKPFRRCRHQKLLIHRVELIKQIKKTLDCNSHGKAKSV